MAAVDYSRLTVPEIKKRLDEKSISYKSSDNKATLLKMLEGEQ